MSTTGGGKVNFGEVPKIEFSPVQSDRELNPRSVKLSTLFSSMAIKPTAIKAENKNPLIRP